MKKSELTSYLEFVKDDLGDEFSEIISVKDFFLIDYDHRVSFGIYPKFLNRGECINMDIFDRIIGHVESVLDLFPDVSVLNVRTL